MKNVHFVHSSFNFFTLKFYFANRFCWPKRACVANQPNLHSFFKSLFQLYFANQFWADQYSFCLVLFHFGKSNSSQPFCQSMLIFAHLAGQNAELIGFCKQNPIYSAILASQLSEAQHRSEASETMRCSASHLLCYAQQLERSSIADA